MTNQNDKQTEAEANAAAQQAPATTSSNTGLSVSFNQPAPTPPAEKAPEPPEKAQAKAPTKAAEKAHAAPKTVDADVEHAPPVVKGRGTWYHDADHGSTQERSTAQRARDEAAGFTPPAEVRDADNGTPPVAPHNV